MQSRVRAVLYSLKTAESAMSATQLRVYSNNGWWGSLHRGQYFLTVLKNQLCFARFPDYKISPPCTAPTYIDCTQLVELALVWPKRGLVGYGENRIIRPFFFK